VLLVVSEAERRIRRGAGGAAGPSARTPPQWCPGGCPLLAAMIRLRLPSFEAERPSVTLRLPPDQESPPHGLGQARLRKPWQRVCTHARSERRASGGIDTKPRDVRKLRSRGRKRRLQSLRHAPPAGSRQNPCPLTFVPREGEKRDDRGATPRWNMRATDVTSPCSR